MVNKSLFLPKFDLKYLKSIELNLFFSAFPSQHSVPITITSEETVTNPEIGKELVFCMF